MMAQQKAYDRTHIARLAAKMRAGGSESATDATSEFRSIFQADVARRPRQSPLNALIEELVQLHPKIRAKDLRKELEVRAGQGVIVKITADDVILYKKDNGEIGRANGAGLDDRLSRVKRKIRKAG